MAMMTSSRDRYCISAYDVILKNVNVHPIIFVFITPALFYLPDGNDNDTSSRHRQKGIPDKGRVLTEFSLYCFDRLKNIIPNHFVILRIEEMPEEVRQHREQLEGHTILVKKAEVIPLEAIVRGYITAEQQHLFY
ncbi:hypothetical protein BJV74DRAFT_885504 [Russula compacta]|nr:hypothetical protein BJV74DRAFT_885504 [Russula compacta]